MPAAAAAAVVVAVVVAAGFRCSTHLLWKTVRCFVRMTPGTAHGQRKAGHTAKDEQRRVGIAREGHLGALQCCSRLDGWLEAKLRPKEPPLEQD